MSSVIKQKIYLSSEAQTTVEAGDTLAPTTTIALVSEQIKRAFLPLLLFSSFNQKRKNNLVIVVSVGDEVKIGEALVFYPRPFMRLFFAMKSFFSDEDVTVSQQLRQFLLSGKSQKKWWVPLFVPTLCSPSDGVVEVVSSEGNMLVVAHLKNNLPFIANTYGTVVGVTKNRIEIESSGRLLTAGFGYGERVGGLLNLDDNADAPILFEKGVLNRERVVELQKSECRGVVANGITVDAIHLLHSSPLSKICTIVAFLIVEDEKLPNFVVRQNDFPSHSRVTLLPHQHPWHASHASALIVHGEEQ